MIPLLLRVLAYVFIATAMFSLGMQTSLGELREAVTDRRFLGRAALANLVFAPAWGLVVALLAPVAVQVRVGIALVALAPGAPLGVQFTRLVKEGTARAVAVTLMLTLVSILYTPLAAAVLLPLEAPVHLPYARVLATVVLFLGLPVALGILVARRKPAAVRVISRPLVILATVAFLSLMVLSADLRKTAYQSIGSAGVVAMLVVILGAMAIGWSLGGPAREHRRILAAATSTRNVAISYLVARSAFPGTDVDVVVLAFFALMIPANMLLMLGGAVARRVRG